MKKQYIVLVMNYKVVPRDIKADLTELVGTELSSLGNQNYNKIHESTWSDYVLGKYISLACIAAFSKKVRNRNKTANESKK